MTHTIPTIADREVIRSLAARWAEIAALPVMAERKRQWRALHDLRPERPMILFEPATVHEYVAPDELRCEHPVLRAVEATMREHIRHFDEVGDDIVFEPYYRIGWDLVTSTWGVDVLQVPAAGSEDGIDIGYTFDFPIKTPADIGLLRPAPSRVDREGTLAKRRLLEDAFGDLLPIRVGNYDHFMVESGAESWAGNYFIGLTWQIYRFIGNDGLLSWVYESPETIHALMEYMAATGSACSRSWSRRGSSSPTRTTSWPARGPTATCRTCPTRTRLARRGSRTCGAGPSPRRRR